MGKTANELKNGLVCLVLSLFFCATAFGQESTASADTTAALLDLPLEKLMEIEISSTATLTSTKPRLVPASITTITEEEIQACGARSLFEALDVYVPNLQWIRNHWEADNLGLRGIMNDRDDKYLILVNGRVMNERTHYGALSERDIPMMKDIHHIDVVRGPGSALYGPGAVAMVINIVTHNAETFEGTEVIARAGSIEEYYTTEIRHGRKFSDGNGGIFAYAGIGKYKGADKHDAPQIHDFDFPSGQQFGWDTYDTPADGTKAGHPLLNPSPNYDGEAHRDLPPMKLYTEITLEDWTIWARYTRSGKQFAWTTGTISRAPNGGYNWEFLDWVNGSPAYIPLSPNSYGYQQATTYIGRKIEVDAQTVFDVSFSYDMFNYERYIKNAVLDSYREDKYYGKAILNHEINKNHKVAMGVEVLHGEYGLDGIGWPDGDTTYNDRLGDPMPRWSTNMYSLLFEHQWTINDQWTSFVGARVDDHTYTDKMFSPRAALIFAPNKQDVWKLMWARSVRANYEEEMKMSGDSKSKPEILDSLELRYERKQNENLDLAASTFLHYSLKRITWSAAANGPAVVGTQKEWGVELEATYHNATTRLGISHGFTKLIDFQLADPSTQDVAISGKPYGYGNDLAQWANHITKINGQYKLDDKWTLDGSMRIYWGFPGMKDYNHYIVDKAANPLSNPGWEKSYRGNYLLNLGLQYQPNKNLTFRIDGYNLLGIFDINLNKRNYYAFPDYRCAAPAAGVSMTYKF